MISTFQKDAVGKKGEVAMTEEEAQTGETA
jgi:hypothetical protein